MKTAQKRREMSLYFGKYFCFFMLFFIVHNFRPFTPIFHFHFERWSQIAKIPSGGCISKEIEDFSSILSLSYYSYVSTTLAKSPERVSLIFIKVGLHQMTSNVPSSPRILFIFNPKQSRCLLHMPQGHLKQKILYLHDDIQTVDISISSQYSA